MSKGEGIVLIILHLLITSDYALSTAVTSYVHGTAILKTTNNEYFLLTK